MNPTINVLGLELPRMGPAFYGVLAVHVPAALAAVVLGAVAALSRKGSRRHVRAGIFYFRALAIAFLTASILAVMRWREDYHLLLIGVVSFAAACYGHLYQGRHRPGHRPHIAGMGLSYVAMLTAFYVDNGSQLPLWNRLPHVMYWVLPIAFGAPIIVRALRRAPTAEETP
jgi:hypothetical protein